MKPLINTQATSSATDLGEVSFDCSEKDAVLITRIVKRSREFAPSIRIIESTMDLTACHCNGCPLDLEGLLTANEFNLLHDVHGIRRHINTENGKLEDCFRPRFARKTI